MSGIPQLTGQVAYLALIFGLLVVPRALQRLLIPAPLTSFGLGLVAALFLGASRSGRSLPPPGSSSIPSPASA